MAERRDFDDIKLIAGAEEPLKLGAGVSPQDLADLDSDLLGASNLDSGDLNEDLLDDLGELSATAARSRRRKSSSLGGLVTLLILLVLGGGGAYAYLNKDVLMPMVMQLAKMGKPAIKPAPGDLPEVTTGPALPPVATATPTPAPTPPTGGGPTLPAPTVPAVPGADSGTAPVGSAGTTPSGPPTVPPVVGAEPPPMDVGFSDGLPQPESVQNTGTPADVMASVATTDVTGDTNSGGAVVKDGGEKKPSGASQSTTKGSTGTGSAGGSAKAGDSSALGAIGSSPALPAVPTVPGQSGVTAPDQAGLGSLTVPSVPSVPSVPAVPSGGPGGGAVGKGGPDSKNNPSPHDADPTDIGDLKMPQLPDVEKSMSEGGGFIESKDSLNELSDMSERHLKFSPEQKAQGLGISVGKSEKPPAKLSPETTKANPGAKKGKGLNPSLGSQDVATSLPATGGAGGVTAPEIRLIPEIEERIAAANRALDLERFPAALDMFTDLYKANPRDERILMGRAIALQKLGRTDEAISAYDELLSISPDNPDALINALGLVRQKNPQEALSRLMDLRQKYPTNATIAAQIGLVNAELRNYDDGIKFLNIAADLESTNPKHFFNMAVIAERMGRIDMAIDYYERALKADALSSGDRNKIDRDMIYDRLSYLRQGTIPEKSSDKAAP